MLVGRLRVIVGFSVVDFGYWFLAISEENRAKISISFGLHPSSFLVPLVILIVFLVLCLASLVKK